MQDNAILNAIAKRSSIREYTGEVVSRDQLETIIKAGMAAPSAMNHQPWEFVAIDDRALLDKLGDVLPYAKMLHKAGAAIAVCGNVEKDCPAPYNSIWIHDCSAATENILLAVEALGLGAVWTAVEPSDALVAVVKDALKLPDNVVPLCVIPIGHPAVEAKPKDKLNPKKSIGTRISLRSKKPRVLVSEGLCAATVQIKE